MVGITLGLRCALHSSVPIRGRGRGRAPSQPDNKWVIIVGDNAVYAREYGINEVIMARLECIRGHVNHVVFQITCPAP